MYRHSRPLGIWDTLTSHVLRQVHLPEHVAVRGRENVPCEAISPYCTPKEWLRSLCGQHFFCILRALMCIINIDLKLFYIAFAVRTKISSIMVLFDSEATTTLGLVQLSWRHLLCQPDLHRCLLMRASMYLPPRPSLSLVSTGPDTKTRGFLSSPILSYFHLHFIDRFIIILAPCSFRAGTWQKRQP